MNSSINKKANQIDSIRRRTAKFFKKQGRRPRILITRIDPMCADREVKILATALADMGFDVDINTSVQSSVDIVRLASENDVHAVGIPGISDHNRELVSKLIRTFDDKDGKNTLVALWTPYQADEIPQLMIKSDRVLIFTIDTETADCANRILELLEQLF